MAMHLSTFVKSDDNFPFIIVMSTIILSPYHLKVLLKEMLYKVNHMNEHFSYIDAARNAFFSLAQLRCDLKTMTIVNSRWL